ncbi:DUF2004 domain-containing protein [Capnocytophaga sp.]|uniref:DUF2004 domain-containing protein n=1 Tax=Capnocytophaga sp. TaxID=44737 RepID=UPI0026DBBD03|nr:DUF2004 domain-containing protein [Capnocytophaga sp.]MDO5105266.1 DUF2004 domain-containing protein [Capnocytophaga sp.]
MTTTIKHPYFGELEADNVSGLGFWDFPFDFQGEPLDVALWEVEENKGISTEKLDFFADFLKDFEHKNQLARQALQNYLNEDDYYITFHKDDMQLVVPELVTDFVEAMVISGIGCWGDGVIVIDYMIDPDESDEILAVKFDQTGNIKIVWES